MNSEVIRQRNNIRIFGKGERTLCFAHGFGCDQTMWRRIVPHFERDYRILLFDYVGCGGASLAAYSTQRYSTLEGYARDLIEIGEALELSKVIFVGHSVSATIGALASIERPYLFSELIMVCPSPRYIDEPPGYIGGFVESDINGLIDLMVQNHQGWASYLAPIVMKNPDNPPITQELESSFCSTDPLTARQFARATFYSDNREDMKKIPVPCLIMQCSDDSIAPASVGDFLARTIPSNVLVHMRATGHCPHVSHPEETISVIESHLSTNPADPR
jgi:sigma-B regulation protein RsbQ